MRHSIIVLFVGLVGCSIQDGAYEQVSGSPVDHAYVDKIVRGRTTYGEVFNALGAPQRVTHSPDGQTLEYESIRKRQAKETLLGITTQTHTQTVVDHLSITVDVNGHVIDFKQDFSSHE